MCKVTSKTFITITSLVFWLAAGGLIFLGAWVYNEYKHYDEIAESLYTLVPATIFMAVGVFFFLLGIVGCVGACKEQRCLLGLFFTILLVVLVGMVTAGIFGYIKRADVDTAIKDGIDKGMMNYHNSTTLKDEIDFMQKEIKCCGSYNYTDWFNTPYGQNGKVPDSCCSNSTCPTPVHPRNMYNDGTGCYKEVKEQFKMHLGIIAGVAAGFAALLILGMIFSCVLVCTRRSDIPYIGLDEGSGMRV